LCRHIVKKIATPMASNVAIVAAIYPFIFNHASAINRKNIGIAATNAESPIASKGSMFIDQVMFFSPYF